MVEYKKLKCVYCDHEQASKSLKPRCYKCGSRRLNVIDNFSIGKLLKRPIEDKKILELKPMNETKQEDKKIDAVAPVAVPKPLKAKDPDDIFDDDDDDSDDDDDDGLNF